MVLNNGGSAFPAELLKAGVTFVSPGVTLRDYFAAKAMQSYIQHFLAEVPNPTDREVSACAYATADAMLAERDK